MIPRGANIDVVEDAILIAFERDGFNLIDQHGPISRYLQTWGRERIRRSNQPFPGKHWDEISVVQARKSWVALARMVTIPVAIILFTLALVGTLFLTADLSGNSRNLLLGGGVAILVGMVLWSIWMWEDWRNDDLYRHLETDHPDRAHPGSTLSDQSDTRPRSVRC